MLGKIFDAWASLNGKAVEASCKKTDPEFDQIVDSLEDMRKEFNNLPTDEDRAKMIEPLYNKILEYVDFCNTHISYYSVRVKNSNPELAEFISTTIKMMTETIAVEG